MLVLGRRVGESIEINANGEVIRVAVLRRRRGGSVTLGVEALPHVSVRRAELADRDRPTGQVDDRPSVAEAVVDLEDGGAAA